MWLWRMSARRRRNREGVDAYGKSRCRRIDTSGSIAAFERMEEKADKLLDAANAEAELNEGIHSTADLAYKYASGSSTSVDDELAQMKAELGL